MAEKKSRDVTVAIIMPYQLGSFLKLHVIMSAVKCRSLGCWQREAGCLSQCLRIVSSLYAAEIPQLSCIKSFQQSVPIIILIFLVNFLSVSFN